MNILFAISSLGAGGAERVITLIADEFSRRGHRITLLTLECIDRDFFGVLPTVNRVSIGSFGRSRNWFDRLCANVRRIMRFREAVRRTGPSIVVSFITEMNVLALLACVGLPTKVIISERIDPSAHDPGRMWSVLRALTYPHAAALVVQTAGVASWFMTTLRRAPLISVIPNPVAPVSDSDSGWDSASRESKTPYLFAAGRLVPQKGFDLLIRALSMLVGEDADLQLVIAGEGPEDAALRRLAGNLGVSERVRFVGRIRNMHEVMRGSLAFVLPSRYEGFPNVLLEALACGVPTIASDCRSGPREVLGNERFGLLVPCEDVEGLAQAVRRVRSDVELRKSLQTRGPVAAARFSVPAVVDRWEETMALCEAR